MLFGCSQDSDGESVVPTTRSKPVVEAYVWGTNYYYVYDTTSGNSMEIVQDSAYNVEATTRSSPLLDSVGVNVVGATPAYSFRALFVWLLGSVYSGGAFLPESFFSPNTLTFNTQLGEARADFQIPSRIYLASHVDGDSVNAESNVTLQWNDCADFYVFRLSFQRQPYSYGGSSLDTVLANPTFTLPQARIPPEAIALLVWIRGGNGPFPGRGAQGNITGACDGFLYAYNSLDSADVEVTLKIKGRGLGKSLDPQLPLPPLSKDEAITIVNKALGRAE